MIRSRMIYPAARAIAARGAGRCLLAVAGLLLATRAFAATYYVDGSNLSASDSGPGSSSQPFKTIQAAVSQQGLPGNTIMVRPATYREAISMSSAHSGTSSSPLVLEATAPGVLVLGSDDFSSTAKWSLVSGSVYLASTVTWSPAQVFLDGARLAIDTTATSPASIAANSFRYVSGSGLYVNVGGANPGSHKLEIGHRTHAVSITGFWMVLDGFGCGQTEDHAVQAQSDSAVTIQNCTVTFSNKHGFDLNGCTNVLLQGNLSSDNRDHGIYLNACTRCTVRGNTSLRNARPTVHAANGIDVNGSTNCTVEGNRCHDNQDTGIQFFNGSNNCLSRNNVSWNNQDHGYDHLHSTGVRHRDDVAYGNLKDGFSMEGGSAGVSLYDCIAVENGLTTDEFDLWVDSTSTSGFTSDYNIFWNSTSQVPFKLVTTRYARLSDYVAATGQDAHSIQADPRFVDGPGGDFHPSSGSPAIDDAIASVSDWPATDLDGGMRRDDPQTANTGVGPVPYADRGALEYVPGSGADHAPVVAAPASVSVAENAPLSFVVHAADPDGNPITSFAASGMPQGASFTPGDVGDTSGTFAWTPGFSAAGSYSVTFTATNALTGSATTSVLVGNVDRAPLIAAPPAASVDEGAPLSFVVHAADPDGDAITGLTVSGMPPGATLTLGPADTTATFAWTPGFDAAGGYALTFTASNALSSSASTNLTVNNVDRAPVVAAPASRRVAVDATLSLAVHAQDPDGDAVTSLTASGLPPGASFAPGDAGDTSGTVTWTPTASSPPGPFTVTFTAGNALSGSATTTVSVDHPPTVVAPASVTVAENAPLSFVVHAADPDGDAIASLAALGLPPGATFTPLDAGDTSGTFAWTPGFDAAGADTVAFIAANALADTVRTLVTVTNVDRAPRVAAPESLRVVEGATASFTVHAADSDGDAITSLVADGMPPGADFAPVDAGDTSGVFTWTPPSGAAAGPYAVTFTASNALADSVVTHITIDHPPMMAAPDSVTVAENAPLAFAIHARDPDGDPITSLVALDLPPGAGFIPADAGDTSGSFAWTPDFSAAGAYTVAFVAANTLRDTVRTVITVTNVDRAPVVVAPASRSVAEQETLTFVVHAADLDGDAIASLTASGPPSGASFTPADAGDTSGTFTWTPPLGSAGSETVIFVAANALTDTARTVIVVTPPDRAPVVTAPDTASVNENAQLTVTVTASDPDGQAIATLTADLSGLPAGSNALFTPNASKTAGTLTWTPTFVDGRAAPYHVTFTAANALSGSDSTAITVRNVDRAPVVTAPAIASGSVGTTLTVTVTAADSDGDAIAGLTADLGNMPAGNNAAFTPNGTNTGGTLTWTPQSGNGGPYIVTFTASNALSGSASTSITARAATVPPSYVGRVASGTTSTSSTSKVLSAGRAVTAGDGLVVAVLLSSTRTGTVSVVDAAGNAYAVDRDQTDGSAGDRVVVLSAHDVKALAAGQSITVTYPSAAEFHGSVDEFAGIGALDRAASGFATSSSFNSGAAAATTQASELVFGVVGDESGVAPTWAAGYTALPILSISSDRLAAAYKMVSAMGSYSASGTCSGTWMAAVVTYGAAGAPAPPDQAPIVSAPATASVSENGQVTVNVTAADPDGQAITSLTANLSGLPAGNNAVFTPSGGNTAGTLTWTPTFADGRAQAYNVTFTASNALSGSGSTAITVNNVDRAPVVTAPATMSAPRGSVLSLSITVADPDGDAITTLTANLSALPAGNSAVFTPNANQTAGTLTWTPQAGDAAGPYTVSFTASNALSGNGSSAITVTAADQAPVVTAPATASVNENAQLTVNVTAADPDGQAITNLTANLTNLPAGSNAVFTANANKTAGTLTWTPKFVDGQVAPYNVTFTASNTLSGSATTAITVNNVDRAPVVTAPATASGTVGTQLTVTVTAADSDGDAITSLTANLANLPAGNNAVFTPNGSNTGGTLTWTPLAGNTGPYNVTFTASNALSGTATTAITASAAASNLVTNPGFETNTTGWANKGATTFARVAGGHTGGFCCQVTLTTKATFGIHDLSPHWVPSTTVGSTYHVTMWVRSPASHGLAKIKVREYLNSVLQGTGLTSGLALSTAWQQVTLDYVAHSTGAYLDLELDDYAVASGETMQLDDISITKTGPGPALPLAQSPTLEGLSFAARLTPNPVHGTGDLLFSTTRGGAVKVEVFDVAGRLVSQPLDEAFVPAGHHGVTLTGADGGRRLGAGAYFYRLQAAEGSRIGKFVVVE